MKIMGNINNFVFRKKSVLPISTKIIFARVWVTTAYKSCFQLDPKMAKLYKLWEFSLEGGSIELTKANSE